MIEKTKNKEQKKRPTLCVDLLNTFSKKELAGFGEFITYSYFNTDKIVVQLFKALQKYIIQKSVFFDVNLQCRVYEFVFKKLPNNAISLSDAQKTQLNRKLNLLLRLAEEFLAINSLRANKHSNINYLYPELLKRKQHSLYKRHFKKKETEFKETTIKDIPYYESLSKFNWLYIEYLFETQKIENEINIHEYVNAIDLVFLLKRLDIRRTVLSLNNFTTKKIKYEIDKPIKDLLNLSKYFENTTIKMFRVHIALEQKMEVNSFENLLNFIDLSGNTISKTDLVGLYLSAINFCAKEISKGNLEYFKASYKIYKNMHHKKLLLIDNNILQSTLYSNIISTSCNAKKIKWAKEICQYYRPYLIKEIRESAFQYNLGIIAFFKKEYDTAHSHFIKVDRTNTSIDIYARIYILICLYESHSEYNYQFLQNLRTTKDFFKKQVKLSSQKRTAFFNFTSTILKLYNCQHGKARVTHQKIKEELLQMNFVYFKPWLVEKIEEFSKKEVAKLNKKVSYL